MFPRRRKHRPFGELLRYVVLIDKENILCIKNESGQNIVISWQRNQPNTLPTAVALDYGQHQLSPKQDLCFLRGI
jgi:hypothetical protein